MSREEVGQMCVDFVTAEGNRVPGFYRSERPAVKQHASKPIFGLTNRVICSLLYEGSQIFHRHSACLPNPIKTELESVQLGVRAWQAWPLLRFLTADRLSFEPFIVCFVL